MDVKSLASRSWPTREPWWATAVAIGHLVLIFAVLAGIGHSGARYFYCEALGLMPTDPCAQASEQPRCPVEALDSAVVDCCEVVTLPAMPQGARAASPSVPPASRVAVIAPGWLANPWIAKGLGSSNWAPRRWRPPPRGPNEARAQLMVFLT